MAIWTEGTSAHVPDLSILGLALPHDLTVLVVARSDVHTIDAVAAGAASWLRPGSYSGDWEWPREGERVVVTSPSVSLKLEP